MKQEIKHKVAAHKTTQSAIPELGIKEKTLYYLFIGTAENNVMINIGEKTYDKINELNAIENLPDTNKTK